MFEDRTKSNKYDFNKIDSAVRTKVITENTRNTDNMTEAQKKLFSAKEPKPKEPILPRHKDLTVENMPSSKYLQSFGQTMTVGEASSQTEELPQEQTEPAVEQRTKTQEQIQEDNINFEKLIDEASEVKIDEKAINKELKDIAPTPKKSYSFRIKLVTGVYCILVALFGGWVIGNAVDIARTNANIYETALEQERVSADIEKIVLKIKNFDDASQNPEDDSTVKKMITETIETTPEAPVEPNEYVVESNWFDVFCNWLSKLFGGK